MKESLLTEYINKKMHADLLGNELQKLIKLYNEKRKSYLFVYASDFEKGSNGADISLIMNDYHMIHEMLRKNPSKSIDIYLETPGGSGEAAEEIVEFLHSQFNNVNFIIAGDAKSAGTLMAMSADEIYMTESGSLGPIDAQVKIGRSTISAFDYVQWISDTRAEAGATRKLNPVDAQMIAQISPGEFESVYRAQQFAIDKLKEWLPKYKFKHWIETDTNKNPVTEEMKSSRAEEIATRLINRKEWFSHGKSLKIKDLERIGLRINRLEAEPELCDIVYRIKTVVKLLFGSSSHFKLFVTESEKIFRDMVSVGPNQILPPIPLRNLQDADFAEMNITCNKCGKNHKLFAVLKPLSKEAISKKEETAKRLPKDNKLICDCGFQFDLLGARNQIQQQTKKKIID